MDSQRVENRVEYSVFGGQPEQHMTLVEVNRPEPTRSAIWRAEAGQTP